jgi:hypothetical protein
MKFYHCLTLVFVIAKLTHYIDWSWWWVMSPLIITGVFVFFDALANPKKYEGK